MTKLTHRIYIIILSGIVIITLAYLIISGFSYYKTGLSERFFHPDYVTLKPSGILGHGLGILGSFFMIFGIAIYMLRKRWQKLSRLGLLKHWLEFHIFLCTLGPILVLFHTSFKFGGIVSISFWSMVAVFLSGIIGRFIYIQIPRSIQGRELSLHEVKSMKSDLSEMLKNSSELDEDSYHFILESTKKKVELYHGNVFSRYFTQSRNDFKLVRKVRAIIRKSNFNSKERKKLVSLVKNEISLNRRIERLDTMKNLFKYWHVAHLPFAIVMITIMLVHVAITVTFGYRWLF
ncbi:MAG: hypothetical protein ISR55_12510 [Bacteroidetes bacterium]|nr:hypothetical protein [Bacteroidota bacterium]